VTRPMPPKELSQLLRLRELRVQAAERECEQRRRALHEAEAALQQRQQRIADWQQRRASLSRQVVGAAAPQLARFAPHAAAQRAWLEDQLERDEYGLIDDEEERGVRQQALDDAMREWQRQRAREDGMRDLLQQARGQLQRLEELRAELDAEDRLVRRPAAKASKEPR